MKTSPLLKESVYNDLFLFDANATKVLLNLIVPNNFSL